MQDTNWEKELEFDELDEQSFNAKKRNAKQRKRKWREIEAFKEQQRIHKEMELYDSYSY
ncbi:DUF3545 family protein [Thalassotalea sp. PLHSN55]|uniref:DUF3545 family protein n=1 Tax=Thalassotalea sp. PLHSN55 TaxID=3435888 RepID=UPI003F8512A8